MTAQTIQQALSLVMADVQAVRKGDRNRDQGFSFRGIDSVVNAVGPALRTHGVVCVPVNVEPTFTEYKAKSGASMRNCTIAITWRFYGPAGDHIEAQTLGEAADAGDKSVSKAHSVAYRTLLLQALCIPTDEPDADASTHERAEQQPFDPTYCESLIDSATSSTDLASVGEALNAIEMPHAAHQALLARYKAREQELKPQSVPA